MTESKGIGRGGFRVFRGKKAKLLRASMRRLQAERERRAAKVKPEKPKT